MRLNKTLLALGLSFLVSSCGGSGSGEGELELSSVTSRVEQDLICCITWDDSTNSCTEYAIPATKEIEITLNQAQVEEEFEEKGSLLFKECNINVIPNPNLPPEAKDPTILNQIASYIHCTASDIPPEGNGKVVITYSQGLVKGVISPLWEDLGRITLSYTVEVKLTYEMGDEEFKKEVEIPIDFDDFIYAEHDMCQE